MKQGNIWGYIYYIGFLVLFFYVASSVIHNTIIYADGSGISVSMLATKEMVLYDEMRRYGLIIRQIFAWLYLNMVKNPSAYITIKLLSFGYSFWNSFFYMLAIGICIYNGSEKGKLLSYFTIVIFCFHYIFTAFNLVLESSMAASLFWFVFVWILLYKKEEKNSKALKVVVLIALILSAKIYASFMFFGMILLLTFIKSLGIKYIAQKPSWYVYIFLLIYDVIMSLFYAIRIPNEQSRQARDGLIASLKQINPSFYIFFGFWLLIGIVLVWHQNGTIFYWNLKKNMKQKDNELFYKLLNLLQIVFIIFFMVHITMFLTKYISLIFVSRSLNIILPVTLSGIVLYLLWGKFDVSTARLDISVLGLLCTTFIFVCMSSSGYDHYLKSLVQITSHQEGFIPCNLYNVEQTGYMTTFTMPQESIMAQTVQGKGTAAIQSILVQPKEMINYEPFNSYDIKMYPDLSHYNIFFILDKFNLY